MPKNVETFENLSREGYAKYLFLVVNEAVTPVQFALWIADEAWQSHTTILTASGKDKSDIRIAGALNVTKNKIFVDGSGSGMLFPQRRDPKRVIEFILELQTNESKDVVES